MIPTEILDGCIIEGTSDSLRNWILFTNGHHNDNRTAEKTAAIFKKHTIGKYIDFDKLDPLITKPVRPVNQLKEGSMIDLNKSTRLFLKEVKRLEDTLEALTGIQRTGAVWPFGRSRECFLKDCYKRADGLWQQHHKINTHAPNDKGGYGYDVIFLWRIKPNYCCAGRPVCTSDKQQAFLDESETEKILYSIGEYDFVWRWDTIRKPTENVWGMDMGKTFFELRKDGDTIVKSYTKAEFIRNVKALSI